MVFGGVNELGEQLKTIRLLTIENEEKNIHKISETGNELEEGDAFVNSMDNYHLGDNIIVLSGVESVWTLNIKEKKLNKFTPLIQ